MGWSGWYHVAVYERDGVTYNYDVWSCAWAGPWIKPTYTLRRWCAYDSKPISGWPTREAAQEAADAMARMRSSSGRPPIPVTIVDAGTMAALSAAWRAEAALGGA